MCLIPKIKFQGEQIKLREDEECYKKSFKIWNIYLIKLTFEIMAKFEAKKME